MKKFFIFIFYFSLLIVGQSALAKMKSDVLNYIPQLNPTPKYFMTVQGNIDPALKNKIKLIWTADYETTNPTCRKAVSAAEGAYSPRNKSYQYKIIPNEKGSYKTIIPLNQIYPGKCHWQIIGIGYVIYFQSGKEINNANTGISFSSKAKFNGKSIYQKWLCKKEKCYLLQDELGDNVFGGLIKRQQSFLFILDIEAKKND